MTQETVDQKFEEYFSTEQSYDTAFALTICDIISATSNDVMSRYWLTEHLYETYMSKVQS